MQISEYQNLPKRKAPVYKTAESAVKAACMGWLSLNKIFAWRNNTGSFKPQNSSRWIAFGFKGSPDIIGMTKRGRFLGVECKSTTGELSVEQIAFKQAVEREGGLYIVARSSDDLEKRKTEIVA